MKKIKQGNRINVRIDDVRKMQYLELAKSRQMELSSLIRVLLDNELGKLNK